MYRTNWTPVVVAILLGLVFLTGYNYFFRPFGIDPSESVATLPDTIDVPSDSIDPQILLAEQLATLTPRQKVLQVLTLPLDLDAVEPADLFSAESDAGALLAEAGVVVLFGSEIDLPTARGTMESLENALVLEEIPLWVAVDHEGGVVQRLSGVGFSRLPSWQELCLLDEADRRLLLEESADELSVIGIDLVFAPVVDTGINNPVMGDRICSENDTIVSQRAIEFVEAFAAEGIWPTIKHFPGLGAVRVDTHDAFARVQLTFTDTQVFRDVLERFGNVPVMVAHVGVVNQDPDIPCSVSPDCVGELKTSFPDTLLVSDAIDMAAAAHTSSASAARRTLPEIAEASLLAGIDLVVLGTGAELTDAEVIVEYLVEQYLASPAFAARVDEAALTMLRYKQVVLDEGSAL